MVTELVKCTTETEKNVIFYTHSFSSFLRGAPTARHFPAVIPLPLNTIKGGAQQNPPPPPW